MYNQGKVSRIFSIWRYLLIVLMTFVSAGALFAQDTTDNDTNQDLFRKGQLFVDFGFGGGAASSPALNAVEDDSNSQFIGIMDLSSTDPTRYMFGLYLINSSGKHNRTDLNGRIGIEYAINSVLGLGASVQSTQITIDNVAVYDGLLFFGWLFNPNTSLSPLEILGAKRETVKMSSLNTVDFDLGLHLPGTEYLDPYVRFSPGIGSVEGGTIVKAGATLGMRFKIANSVTLNLEGYGNAMMLSFPAQEDSGESSSTTTVSEGGGRIGFGMVF